MIQNRVEWNEEGLIVDVNGDDGYSDDLGCNDHMSLTSVTLENDGAREVGVVEGP